MKRKHKNNKKPNILRGRPYVSNRITFTTELYPNENASKSIFTAKATGIFNIRLIHLLAALGAGAAALTLTSKIMTMTRK